MKRDLKICVQAIQCTEFYLTKTMSSLGRGNVCIFEVIELFRK